MSETPTCPRCGLLVGDHSVHERWHRQQDQLARMVLRPALEKLAPVVAPLYDALPRHLKVRAALRRRSR